MNLTPDVLIVGGGPAGLAAAARLARRGIIDVLVLEREAEAGGIPRFCPHPTFGMSEFFRPMSGPSYAARWRGRVDPARVATSTTVTSITAEGAVTASTPDGEIVLSPRRMLIATGVRERSRAARLVSGDRPRNVLTTGALQRLIAEGRPLAFRRPIIVGTEMVSFSAGLSLRDHGVRPVAILEAGDRVVSIGPGAAVANLLLGAPVLLGHRLSAINAPPDDASLVETVTVEAAGGRREIACDAVIFTGEFVPELSVLSGVGGLAGPRMCGVAIDQRWRTENAAIYAAGNVLRSVETAAWSAREGAAAADAIADDLGGRQAGRRIPIELTGPIRLVVPSALSLPLGRIGPLHMQVRMERSATGRFSFAADGTEFWCSARTTLHPERRHGLTRRLPPLDKVQKLTLSFVEDA